MRRSWVLLPTLAVMLTTIVYTIIRFKWARLKKDVSLPKTRAAPKTNIFYHGLELIISTVRYWNLVFKMHLFDLIPSLIRLMPLSVVEMSNGHKLIQPGQHDIIDYSQSNSSNKLSTWNKLHLKLLELGRVVF